MLEGEPGGAMASSVKKISLRVKEAYQGRTELGRKRKKRTIYPTRRDRPPAALVTASLEAVRGRSVRRRICRDARDFDFELEREQRRQRRGGRGVERCSPSQTN